MKILILILIFSAAMPAFSESINSYCADSHVHQLRVYWPEGGLDGEANLCLEQAGKLPLVVVQALEDIRDVQIKMATVFNLTRDQAFPETASIYLAWMISGADGSYDPDGHVVSATNSILSDRLVDKAILTHEMTHWLLDSPDSHVPAALKSAGQSVLWGEALPDTVSLAVSGAVSKRQPEVAECLQVRSFTERFTFKNTNGFFSHGYFLTKHKECCDQVYADKRASKASIAVCDDFSEANIKALVTLEPLDPSPFNPKVAAKSLRKYNTYQLGMPINSFLITLKNELQINVFQLFLRASTNLSAQSYLCSLPAVSETVTVDSYSLLDQLKAFRAELNPKQQNVYDRLAQDFKLEALTELETSDRLLRLFQMARTKFLEERPGRDSIVPENSPCFQELGMSIVIPSAKISERCKIQFQLLPFNHSDCSGDLKQRPNSW